MSVREEALRLQAATLRYWELADSAVLAAADAVVARRRALGGRLVLAVRDVAETTGEDPHVILACFRTVHPAPVASRNPIAQDFEGERRRELDVDVDRRSYKLEDEFDIKSRRFEVRGDEIPAELAPCDVCGLILTPEGRTCRGCRVRTKGGAMRGPGEIRHSRGRRQEPGGVWLRAWLCGRTESGRTVRIDLDPTYRGATIEVDGEEAKVEGRVSRLRDGGTTTIPTDHGRIHVPQTLHGPYRPPTLDGEELEGTIR